MAENKNCSDNVSIEEVREYWREKNIPQQWYSKKEPFSVQWFNELSQKRFELYYKYIKRGAEFEYHGKEDVLEVGCGIGTDLVEYAKNGARVSAIDLGEEQIRLTKLNFDLRGLPYEELKVGNAEDISFDNEKFDLVVCFGVLHHTPNTEKAISEIYRVLKSDGQANIIVYARGWKHYVKRCFIYGILLGNWFKNRFNWQKVYNEASEVHGNTPKTAVYTKKQVKNLFKMFGDVYIKKERLGEFIDYPPYRTFTLPKFIRNILYLVGAESLIGEAWLIKAYKSSPPPKESIWNVVFKHY